MQVCDKCLMPETDPGLHYVKIGDEIRGELCSGCYQQLRRIWQARQWDAIMKLLGD